MAALSNIPTETFKGVSYAVLAEGGRWAVGAEEETITKVDPILDGGLYVDTGGTVYGDLTRICAFETSTARDALLAKRGQYGTLTMPSGRTMPALLQKCQALESAEGLHYASVTYKRY